MREFTEFTPAFVPTKRKFCRKKYIVEFEV